MNCCMPLLLYAFRSISRNLKQLFCNFLCSMVVEETVARAPHPTIREDGSQIVQPFPTVTMY